MKLKVSQIYNAALAIEQMYIRCELPYRIVREFQRVKKALRDEADTIRGEQANLVKLHHGTVKDGGKITFAEHEDLAAFEDAWGTLFNESLDIDIACVDMSDYESFICFSNADVDLDSLCNFVVMEKEV